MQFPLTDQLRREALRFKLRSACPDCFFFSQREQRCAHEWPMRGQEVRIDDVSDTESTPASAEFCKEFELA